MSDIELIFGLHAVQALLNQSPERALELFVLREREDAKVQGVLKLAAMAGLKQQPVPRRWFEERFGDAVHQGVALRVRPLPPLGDNDLLQRLEKLTVPPFLLLLDGVTDPHNLGACLRSADAAGVHGVIVPRDKSAPLNPTARKVACGAAEVVPFYQVTNLARSMRSLQEAGVWIIGAAGEATASIHDTKLTGPLALAMGAEGSGLRRLTREHCDALAKIPMVGSVSSLNVSVATGIFLFEALRQRS